MDDISIYGEILFKTAVLICRDYHLAEDIVQDTYVEAVLHRITNADLLTQLCRRIATDRRREENQNIAKPSFGTNKNDSCVSSSHILISNFSQTDSEETPLVDYVAKLQKEAGRKKHISFDAARAFGRGLGIRTKVEWIVAYESGRIPQNIPRRPDSSYKKEWRGWKDFIGAEWLPFDDARAFVIGTLVANSINTSELYIAHGRAGLLPKNIPLGPDTVYKNFWRGWGHWFGKVDARSPRRNILTFEKAREYVLTYMVPLGIDTLDKYNRYVDPPQCLPNDLHHYYKDRGWVGSSHFFQTEKKKIGIPTQCSNYKTVREWCRLNLRIFGIKGKNSFRAYLQGKYQCAPRWPSNFPRNPENYFNRRNQWISYNDLFGLHTNRVRSSKIWPYEKARGWVIENLSHIQTITKGTWKSYVSEKLPLYQLPELPTRMPRDPESYYALRKEWRGWPHFVGRSSETGRALMTFVRLKSDKARKLKRELGIAEKGRITLLNKGIKIQGRSIFLTNNRPITGKRLARLLYRKKGL